MLAKITKISAILAFACLILGFVYLEWLASQPLKLTIYNQTSTQKHNATADNTVEEREKPEDALARYTYWLMIFTGFLAFSTVGLLIATVGLYIAGKRQIKLAREEFISTHRPRVIVRFIQGPFHGPDAQFVLINVVNIGPSLAIVQEFGCELARREGKLWKMAGASASPEIIDPIRLISGRRHTFEVAAKAPYTDAEIVADAFDVEEICVFGVIRYRDENGIIRETGFFRVYDPKSEKFIPSKDPGEEYQD